MANKGSKTTSTTKDVSGPVDSLFNTSTYETTISDGKNSVSNRGNSSQESQQKASDSWAKKKW